MSEPIALEIGSWIARTCLSVWLRDPRLQAADDLSGALAGRIVGAIERRRVVREFELIGDTIADQLLNITRAEPELNHLRKLLNGVPSGTLIAREQEWRTNPAALERIIRDLAGDAPGSRSEPAIRLSCVAQCEVLSALPAAEGLTVLSATLRHGAVAEAVITAVSRQAQLRAGQPDGTFTAYCRALAKAMDSMDYLEVPGRAARRPSLVDTFVVPRLARQTDASEHHIPPPSLLKGSGRTIVIGPPGAGKSTLCRWLVINAARDVLADQPGTGNRPVPFLVRLRDWSPNTPLMDHLVGSVNRLIDPPIGLAEVHDVFARGSAAMVVDGLDELPEPERFEAWNGIRALTDEFPRARFVITARPEATAGYHPGDHFDVIDLLPMTAEDIERFIRTFHAWQLAVSGKDGLPDNGSALLQTIAEKPQVARLASNPLMCTMLCALSLQRRAPLAGSQEIHRAALDMLLDRHTRGTDTGSRLGYMEKLGLLEQIAYWFLVNEVTDVDEWQVLQQVQRAMESMPQVVQSPERVLAQLIESTGILRESAHGRIDFLHQTFQEYLAARAIVSQGSMNLLVRRAHEDRWRDVVLMAAGCAPLEEAKRLIDGLADRANSEPHHHVVLQDLARACIAELKLDSAPHEPKHGTQTQFSEDVTYHTIIAVDIAGFANPSRTVAHQLAMHGGLHAVLREAFSDCGIDWAYCRVEDRGDGAMILAPPGVPKSLLAEQLPNRLAAHIHRFNTVHSAEAAIRLRVAMHAGSVQEDQRGMVSAAVNIAFRLLDSQAAREALRTTSGTLAVIVSEEFYREVVSTDPAAYPVAYRRCAVDTKSVSLQAWVRALGEQGEHLPMPHIGRHDSPHSESETGLRRWDNEDLAARQAAVPMNTIRRLAQQAGHPKDVLAVLRKPGVGILVVVDPSDYPRRNPAFRGDPGELARDCVAGGARVIGVSMGHLAAVRAAVDVPVLSTDTFVSPYQVYEARARGVDMVTLIVAAANQNALSSLLEQVESLGMTALVEVRTIEEADRAVEAGAQVVSVNARNRETQVVDRDAFLRIVPGLPGGMIKVARSRVRGPRDVLAYAGLGADAVLVDNLVDAPDARDTVERLASAVASRWSAPRST